MEFVAWIKEKYSTLLLIFVLANCLSIYQHADVILQWPFKYGFRKELDIYITAMIDKQLEEKQEKNVKLDFRMLTFKSLLCLWLFET